MSDLQVDLSGVQVRAVAEVQAVDLVRVNDHRKVREGSNTCERRNGEVLEEVAVATWGEVQGGSNHICRIQHSVTSSVLNLDNRLHL